MNKQEFRQLFDEKILILDGATGTNLMDAGMPLGVCPEQYILEHKDVMLKLQKAYLDAGTDILYAPTFTCNRIKLKRIWTGRQSISDEYGFGKAFKAGGSRM